MSRLGVRSAWPAVALAVLIVNTLLGVRAERIGHVSATNFITLIVGAAIVGWLLSWLVERPSAQGTRARLSRQALVLVLAAAAVAAFVYFLAHHTKLPQIDAVGLAVVAGAAFLGGGTARIGFGSRALVSQLVFAVALAGWAYYDAVKVFYLPFRDIRLYLYAGENWLSGRPVYLAAPLNILPSDPTRLPFVYPPFLLPFFGALSRVPQGVAIVGWEIAALGAVVVGLKLLGVRSLWVPILVLWPPIAVGLSTGNAASFAFLGLAAGWRWGAALVLAGIFKAQAAIPALWLVRERRWRSLVLGCVAVGALVLVTLPLTGLSIYHDWLVGLAAFEQTARHFRALEGFAIQRYLPEGVAIVVAIVATVAALLATGRMGLSRFGIVAILASPTVYIHGLSLLLPAALWLDAASLWLVLGLIPIGWGALIALGATAAAVMFGLTRSAQATRRLRDEAEEVADGRISLHPLGSTLQPWP